jgi:hypothetical protein
MDRQRLQDSQLRFDGGLNAVSDDLALTPTQIRKAINTRLTSFGALVKRGGTQRVINTVTNRIQNGSTWYKAGVNPRIVFVSNGTLYSATYGSLPWSLTTVSTALSNTVDPVFAQFRDGTNDVLYISDGGALNKWDGTTFTANIAGTTNTTSIVVHNERLWGCGNSNFPNSIFYSALNNGDSLGNGASGGGQIVVRTFGNEEIVGLVSLGTSLLIFHRRGVSRLTGYGQDDITVDPAGLTSDVGLIAPKSITVIDNVCYFVSERGLYRCTEAEVASVSTPDTPDQLLPIIRNLSASQFGEIRAVMNRATRELWISIPSIGVYPFHTTLQAWAGPWDTGYISPDTTALWETLNTSGLPVVLKGDASGYVTLCDAFGSSGTNKDNVLPDGTGGTVYSMTAQLRRMYCGDDALAKSFRFGYLSAQLNGSKSCAVTWKTDTYADGYQLPTSNESVWGTGTWTGTVFWGGASSQNYRVQMSGTGYYVDVIIIDPSTAIPTFSRMQLETFALGRR